MASKSKKKNKQKKGEKKKLKKTVEKSKNTKKIAGSQINNAVKKALSRNAVGTIGNFGDVITFAVTDDNVLTFYLRLMYNEENRTEMIV